MRRLAEMSARTRVAGCVALSVLLMASLVWAAQGRTLKVTVNYTGSGEVNVNNAVYLSVWDTPNMAGGAIPIGQQVVTENGDVASFENLTASSVYVAAVYDETGGWDGASAPPSEPPGIQGQKGMHCSVRQLLFPRPRTNEDAAISPSLL